MKSITFDDFCDQNQVSLSLQAFNIVNQNLADETKWGNWLNKRKDNICDEVLHQLQNQHLVLVLLENDSEIALEDLITLNYQL